MSQRCLLHIFGITGLYSVLSIATSPWFFTRGGHVNLYNGSARVMGREGIYWSSTASTNISYAYLLYFNPSDTQPSRSDWRWLGFSVRCVDGGSYVRSGLANIFHGRLLSFGLEGDFWMTSADKVEAHNGAYSVIITNNAIYPAYSNYEWCGFPLRCLAW